jgi:hypothetical protein
MAFRATEGVQREMTTRNPCRVAFICMCLYRRDIDPEITNQLPSLRAEVYDPRKSRNVNNCPATNLKRITTCISYLYSRHWYY